MFSSEQLLSAVDKSSQSLPSENIRKTSTLPLLHMSKTFRPSYAIDLFKSINLWYDPTSDNCDK